MVISLLKNRAAKKAMESAKASYYKASKLSGLSREARIFKALIGGRSRAHLDKVFIEGAKQSEAYQEACLTALTNGNEAPEMPDPKPFQIVKTKTDSVYTYVPAEFAKEMYALGNLYQTATVGPSETLQLAQELADRVSLDLGLEEPFVAVQFLRDELEDADNDIDTEADAEDGESENS
jgi:hypothetical protein